MLLIADPTEILARPARGLDDLYVALTRATQRLGIIHGARPRRAGGHGYGSRPRASAPARNGI
ncbi:hypothetical protein NRF20_45055 [Streptomyces sp. R-74717]|uniref:hypothetical protein n=1 Tax=Streptomyces TaxID=1883 RepID=UPI00378CD798